MILFIKALDIDESTYENLCTYSGTLLWCRQLTKVIN